MYVRRNTNEYENTIYLSKNNKQKNTRKSVKFAIKDKDRKSSEIASTYINRNSCYVHLHPFLRQFLG